MKEDTESTPEKATKNKKKFSDWLWKQPWISSSTKKSSDENDIENTRLGNSRSE